MTRQNVQFIWSDLQIARRFNSGVSLHSHTSRSREGLGCLPRYAECNPALKVALGGIRSRYKVAVGRDLDFSSSYFLPPLLPAAAYALEAAQVEALGLAPIVSITDHDTIEGPRQLQAFMDPDRVPISLEWTVPFGSAFFHVGVHNIPADLASEVVHGLLEVQCAHCQLSGVSCSGTHDSRCHPQVREWMARISSIPDALLVLNHPLWDTCGVGEAEQRNLLGSFVGCHREFVHALELNGLRSWPENREVMELAQRWRIPLISGGDRHGCEPNAVLNLTTAQSFSEFAQEIRCGGESVIVFLRQYRQPLMLRKLRTVWDVLKNAGETADVRTRWSDRIHVPWIDGRVLPLSAAEWSGAFSHKPIEGPETAERFPGDAASGAEY